MKYNFTTYEMALAIKKLGFDGQFFGLYKNGRFL